MNNLPSGTVTFLFTDIEGSTERWEAHPDAIRSAFARQEEILRHAIKANNGYAYKLTGNAFQAAFATAPQAIQAAADAQLEAIGGSLDSGDHILYERTKESLRTQLGQQESEATQAEGRAMSMEEAIAYALDGTHYG